MEDVVFIGFVVVFFENFGVLNDVLFVVFKFVSFSGFNVELVNVYEFVKFCKNEYWDVVVWVFCEGCVYCFVVVDGKFVIGCEVFDVF